LVCDPLYCAVDCADLNLSKVYLPMRIHKKQSFIILVKFSYWFLKHLVSILVDTVLGSVSVSRFAFSFVRCQLTSFLSSVGEIQFL
jgi:hypothetical protein